jgi:hypothetical protein
MMDAATFIGTASVPMGLVCFGSALARLRVPRGSWDTFPIGTILVLIVGKFMHATGKAKCGVQTCLCSVHSFHKPEVGVDSPCQTGRAVGGVSLYSTRLAQCQFFLAGFRFQE